MGACKSKKKEKLTPEEIERLKQEGEQQKLALLLEQQHRSKMNMHKEKILRRISPPKKKPINEQQLKLMLGKIFSQYDTQDKGVLTVDQFRSMVNKLNFRRTGVPQEYTRTEVKQMLNRINGDGSREVTRDDLYRIYKNL